MIDELDQQGVVHGDISFANIILVPNEGSPYRTGNLIDFETAMKRGSDYFTGTKVVCALSSTKTKYNIYSRTRSLRSILLRRRG